MPDNITTGQAKLDIGATLRPGDIVNDCRFRDLAIRTITPERYYSGPKIGQISDYDIILEDGANCSWMHCCNLPSEVSDEIKQQYAQRPEQNTNSSSEA